MGDPKQPAVVFIHGAFSTPAIYDDFLSALSRTGFIARCPHLPTSSNERPPKGCLEDDIAAVRNEVRELGEAGHPVIAIAHFWGGFVASESISQDLCVSSSDLSKGKGGIIHVIYISAWVLLPGDSIMLRFTDPNTSFVTQVDTNEDGTARITKIEDCFYNDIDSVEERHNLASKHVLHHFTEVAQKATRTPGKVVPTAFVYCEKDVAVPLGLQKSMVADVVGSLPPMSLVEAKLDAWHFPFCSMPDEVVKIVKGVWATTERTGTAH